MARPLMTFTLNGMSFKVDSLAFPHGHAAMLRAAPIIGEGTGPLTEIPLLEWAAHQAKKVRRRQTTPPFLRARRGASARLLIMRLVTCCRLPFIQAAHT